MKFCKKNSEGVPEIIDTNNYYPFGLNHISNSFSNSGFGSFYSYKYNGKELQETGLFDYGWRQYMPDLGKWNGMDQLAESYLSTSTYAYVANNPVSQFDVDGRWFNEDGSIRPSTTFDYMPGSYKPTMSFSTSNGMHYNEGGGGGYTPFGNTQAYTDMMASFQNGGDFSLKVNNGYMSWWTGGALGDANTAQEMIAHMMKLSGSTGEVYSPLSQGNTLLSFNGVYMSSLPYRNYIGTARPNAPFRYRGVRYYGNGQTFLKSSSLIKTQNLIKLGKGVGIGTVLLGGVLDWGYGVPEYRLNPNSPNAVSPQKASLNTGIGIYGLTGVGTIPSLVYFGLDNFYPGGFNGYVNDVGATQTELDNGFNSAGPYRINLMGAHEPK